MPVSLPDDDVDDLLQDVQWQGVQCEERFRLHMERRNGMLFLIVEGKVLQPVPQELPQRIRQLLERLPQARIVIDLSRCDYLSSPFLGFLVEFLRISAATTATTVMLKPKEPLHTIIRLLGISQMFTIVASEQDARNALGAG